MVANIELQGLDSITFSNFILGNIRHIRDYNDANLKPDAIQEQMSWDQGSGVITIERNLTPEHRYRLRLKAQPGSYLTAVDGKVRLVRDGNANRVLSFQLIAESSEPTLTALPINQIVRPEFIPILDQQTLNMLAFVVYKEKWLAGSPNYLTYFGRDSEMSSTLILQALKPEAVEGALAGVLERIDKAGRVSHEETLADYAFYLSGGKSFAPIQDYKMLDSNFMLPVLIAEYLKNVTEQEGNAFLSRRTWQNVAYRDVLSNNLQFTIASAYDFALTMEQARKTGDKLQLKNGFEKLVHLYKGENVGQWRDSETGLGYGRIPYDVNVAILPAALAATVDLYSSPRYGLKQEVYAARAKFCFSVWKTEASEFFVVHVSPREAEASAANYAHLIGLKTPEPRLHQALTFYALALNEDGSPVRVMNSDEGSYLLYGLPTEAELMNISDRLLFEFPYGLMSPVGLLIANPAFADAATQKLFTADHYHGTLSWGREHAVMLEGLLHQLERSDLGEKTRARLIAALDALWQLMNKTEAYQQAELWTWEPDAQGDMRYVAYGQKPTHHTTANPIQTWSLAVAILRESARAQVETLLGLKGAAHAASAN